jgi:o-succinylbenzoate synthase
VNIEYTLYALSGQRKGALLRVNGKGYADCHPWPELGDAPLQKQLELLRKGVTTPLTAQSLFFASIDAQAREKGISLFHNLIIPPSHMLVKVGDHISPGTNCIKLKVGIDVPKEIEYLNTFKGESIKIRLDFNEGIYRLLPCYCSDSLPDRIYGRSFSL